MKKFGILTAFVSGLLMFAVVQGCTDHYNELNTNPSLVSHDVVQPEMLFTRSVREGVYQIPNYSTTVKEFSGTYVSQSSGNIFQQASYGSPWNMYNDDLITISEMLRLTEGDPYYANLHAMGRIWRAWLFQQVTDHYGDIPYFDALKSQDESVPDPAYDPQEEIYKDLMDQLKTAAADLQDSPERAVIASSDLLYSGDIEMWRRFANSLRLRLALRVRFADEQLARDQIADVLTQPLIESNEQNAFVMSLPEDTNHASNRHPLFEQNITSGNPLACSHTLVYSMREDISEDLDMNDPRLPIYCKPAQTDGEYRGNVINRREGFRWFHFNDNISHLGDRFLQSDQPINVITYSEVEFNKAEIFHAGLASGDAEEAYRNGLRASLEFYEVDSGDIEDFLASSAGSLTGSDEDILRQISTQRYLSLFQQTAEAWSEYRRTGYPYIYLYSAYPGHTEGQIPRRVTYPESEYQTNGNRVQEAASRLGGDNLMSRIWWDAREGLPIPHPDDEAGLFPPRPDQDATEDDLPEPPEEEV